MAEQTVVPKALWLRAQNSLRKEVIEAHWTDIQNVIKVKTSDNKETYFNVQTKKVVETTQLKVSVDNTPDPNETVENFHNLISRNDVTGAPAEIEETKEKPASKSKTTATKGKKKSNNTKTKK